MTPTAHAFTASRKLDNITDLRKKGINFTKKPTRKNDGKNMPTEAQSAPEIPFN